jgi:hypothetical protein
MKMINEFFKLLMRTPRPVVEWGVIVIFLFLVSVGMYQVLRGIIYILDLL